MSLDTLANVKTRLGVTGSTDDALLALLQDSADAWIANYCGRDFAGGSFTEYHPGATAIVLLRNYPVQSVTSVRVDPAYAFGATTELAASAYVVHTDRGVIQSLAGVFVRTVPVGWDTAPRTVRVEYATATSAVPADVKQAYALLVDHWYRHVKTLIAASHQNVTQQTFGDTTAIFAKDQIAGLPLPPDVLRLLAPYRTSSL